MSRGRFGRGRKDRLRKLIGLLKPCWQLDAADAAAGFVLFPGRSGKIAANHALHGNHIAADDHHGAAAKLVGIFANRSGILRNLRRDQMVGHDIAEKLEPEQRYLGQDVAFMGNAGGQHIVEGGNAVRGHEKQMLAAQAVHVAHFAAGIEFEVREVGA